MKCSVTSARGFIKLFLSLRDTPYRYHQTLTFQGEMRDRRAAKHALHSLLDILHKQFKMVSLFVEEGYDRNRIHYHVIFFFYHEKPQMGPQTFRKRFGSVVFKHWLRITGGRAVPHANRIRLWRKEPRLLAYLLKEVVLSDTEKESGKPLWHGKRNTKLIAAQSTPVTNKTIREAMDICFPYLKKKRFFFELWDDFGEQGPPYYDNKRLREYRHQVEARGENWREHKQSQTGKKNCTNTEFRRALNQKIHMELNTL